MALQFTFLTTRNEATGLCTQRLPKPAWDALTGSGLFKHIPAYIHFGQQRHIPGSRSSGPQAFPLSTATGHPRPCYKATPAHQFGLSVKPRKLLSRGCRLVFEVAARAPLGTQSSISLQQHDFFPGPRIMVGISKT